MSQPAGDPTPASAVPQGGALRYWGSSMLLGRLGRRGVLLINAILERHYRIENFTDDPECILRASYRRLKEPVDLHGGIHLCSGDVLIELHFWNGHLPFIDDKGADALWGRRFSTRVVYS